ncbi:MAG TPA: thiamine ABC transporter ATP-binding protein, partial [Sulfitobacter pontiacus]|nr:thiamine ABC transporter ATP-binding protein [Sulfitobacter pontiacus]
MLTLETAQITQGSFTLHADLTLAPAQTYAVIGPSGAGKSTLLGALCGFIPLRSGRLLWQGKDITQAAPGARPMTMLFQDNNLFPHLSVMQNVGLGLRPDLRLGTAEQTRVHEALDRVGLQGMA